MTLYAAKAGSNTTSDLYTVDESSAAVASVGATGSAFTGLAFDPTDGTLYGVTSFQSQGGSDKGKLYTLNTSTGAASLVASLALVGSGNKIVPDICFDSTGQMWGYNQSTNRICKINKATGGVTDLASVPVGGSGGYGITASSADVLYWFPTRSWGEVYTINQTTGATTLAHSLDDSGMSVAGKPVGAAACRTSDDTFFAFPTFTTSYLGTVSVSTGVWTQVGATGGGDFDALAWLAGGGGDVTPPTLLSISASANTVTLLYDEPLQVSPGPLTSEFVVTADGTPLTVTVAVASGSTVVLTVSPRVFASQTVLVSYTA